MSIGREKGTVLGGFHTFSPSCPFNCLADGLRVCHIRKNRWTLRLLSHVSASPFSKMALNGHIGSSKGEAAERERACFMEEWTHEALLRAAEKQDETHPMIDKLADYDMGSTFVGAEVEKLDEELAGLQEALGDASLVSQFLQAVRRATRDAIEREENLYFFGDQAPASAEDAA